MLADFARVPAEHKHGQSDSRREAVGAVAGWRVRVWACGARAAATPGRVYGLAGPGRV